MRITTIAAILVILISQLCPAQTTLPSDASDAPNETDATKEAETSDHAWSFSASAYTYFVPDDREYVQPTLTADRDWLHLEARYNYEAQHTGSAWLGYNFAGGDEDKLSWEITPMIGGVFGDTSGVAPGYKGSVFWRGFELYSEGEYLIDTGDTSDSFFYTWSELTFSPVEWFRFGVVGQRTHAYDADRDIQPGLLVGFTYKQLDLAAYVFNPDDDPIVVLGVRFDF